MAISQDGQIDSVEEAWQLRLPAKTDLRRLLMRMIKTLPEDRPCMSNILRDAYFENKETGRVGGSDDTWIGASCGTL